MNIAFFDSGIGGLTVLKEAYQLLPQENFIYYADTEHVPYGTKSSKEIRQYIFEAVDFLAKQNIKMLVVACNTATTAAISDLRAKYSFPIVGMEPAVKLALENHGQKILVLATSFTLSQKKFDASIAPLALDELVLFAEKFDFDSPRVQKYLKNKLSALDTSGYDAVVLGCTHFIFYKNLIQKYLPKNIAILDGNQGTVNNLINILKNKNLVSKNLGGQIIFYSSGIKDKNQRAKKLTQLIINKSLPNDKD